MPTISETKKLFIDIETGKAPDYKLFEPEYKAPKINKDGTASKASKSIEEQQADFESKCVLSPLTGQVLMVGFTENDKDNLFSCSDFADNKTGEWHCLSATVDLLNNNDLIIGHYIKSFDLPFIINRCRKHGIKPPSVGYTKGSKWYWNDNVIDLADLWTFGKHGEYISLNNMAKFFGLEQKDEIIGANFEQIFNIHIDKAIAYCKHDVNLTKQIYDKLK